MKTNRKSTEFLHYKNLKVPMNGLYYAVKRVCISSIIMVLLLMSYATFVMYNPPAGVESINMPILGVIYKK